MRRMQGRGFASGLGFLALVLVAGAAWALTSWGLPEGAQVWLSSDTGVAQLGVSPDGTMALSTLLMGGGWLTTDAAAGGLWLLDGQDHLVALGADGAVGKPLDLAPALGSAQPLGVAVDGAADAAWVISPEQLITVALGSAQSQRTPLPAGVVAWTQDAAQHTLWLASDHRLAEYDAHGRTMTSFALPEVPTAMAYDNGSGQIWMAFANHQIARYTARGRQTLQAPRPTMAAGPMAADGAGGLWIAGRTHVVHLDAEGFVRVRIAVMPETGATASSAPVPGIQALAVDPISHGVWVKTPTTLIALDTTGRVVQSVPISGPMAASAFRSLVLRALPPTGPPAGPSPVQPTPTGGIDTPVIASIPAHFSSIAANTARHAGSAALQPCARGSNASACAPVTAGAPSHPPARILWVAAGHDLYQLLPPATSALALDRLPPPQAVATDPTTGALWAYRHGQLWSVNAAGVVTVDVTLAAKHGDDEENGHASLAIDGSNAVVWLAVGRNLMRLDPTGKLLGTITLTHSANGLSLDTATGQLWVAEHHGLEAFDPSGSLLFTTTVQGTIRALDADAHLDAVWVATQRDLLRLNATGQVQLTVKMHGDADRRMAADGQGGLWIAGGPTLSHVDTGGSIGFSLQPFGSASDSSDHADHGQGRDAKAKGGAIRALAADPLTHAVWVEGRHRLVEESLKEQQLAAVDSRTWPRIDETESAPDHEDTQRHVLGPMALYVDAIPPVLTLVSPAVGTYTNKPQLPLSFSYSDVGSGVDPDTLTIQNTATGQPLAVSCQTTAGTALCTPANPLADGNYTLSATVQDYAGNTSKPVALQFTIDTVPPTITITSPTRTLTNQPDLTLAGTLSKIATLTVNGQPTTVDSTLQFSLPITLTEGTNTYTLVATDRAGNVTTTTLTITLDTVPPPQPDLGLFSVTGPVNGQVTVTGKAGSVEGGDTVTLTDTVTGATVSVTANADGSFTATLAAGSSDPISVSVEDPAGNVTQSPTTIEASVLPPSPSTEAPQLPPTEQAPFVDQVSFLYSGSNPIQTGVAPGTIQPLRVAVVRGQVLDRANQPLSGVTVTVLGHPEYGQTLTRASGWFDLAVNGGGSLVLNFTKNGYLMAQRTVSVPWGNFAIAQPLVMIQPDPVATPVTFGSATTSMQVAQGSVQVGQSGTRQATVFIPAGTTATEVLPNGTSQPLTTAHLRATEFTVGANGPQAMPAALPATSAYTYAVDLSLDEAQAAGATTVTFSQPVPVYVNNYLGIPIGTAVPAGWYDPTVGAWKGSTDGVVLKFLGVDANGDAEVDVTGAGTPATASQLSAYGITTAELAQIAKTFTPGQSFWRVLVPHFTYWDYNYGYNPQAGYLLPPPPQPHSPPDHNPRPTSIDHRCKGCEIDAENQRIGETIPVVGTPYALHYESVEQPARFITFPVTTATPPGNTLISTIEVRVTIAGRVIVQDFDPSIPDQTFKWTWDGLNVYGQKVYAPTQAQITLAYEYKESYGAFIGGTPGASESFAQPPNAPMVGFAHAYSDHALVAATRRWTQVLAGYSPISPLGARRWGLNVLDRYDPIKRIFYGGNGDIRSNQDFDSGYVAYDVAGNGFYADATQPLTGTSPVPATSTSIGEVGPLAVAADGTTYLWDAFQWCVLRVSPNGDLSVFAGECESPGNPSFSSTPSLATQQKLQSVLALAIGPDGGVYAGIQNGIVKISPDGQGVLVLGGGSAAIALGEMADKAAINCETSIAVAPDHSIIFSCGNSGIWRIDPSGVLDSLAVPPAGATFNDVTVSGAGDVYISGSEGGAGAIWALSPNGGLSLLVGQNLAADAGSGSVVTFSPAVTSAADTNLPPLYGIAVGPHGGIYALANDNIDYPDADGEIARLDPSGWVTCISGCSPVVSPNGYSVGFEGDGSPAEQVVWSNDYALFIKNYAGLAVGPDGSIYLPEPGIARVLRLAPSFPAAGEGLSLIGSAGGNYIDTFNSLDQEIERLDAATGKPVYTFQYDAQGFLASVTDAEGRVTTIQRDASENPVSITSPDGQVTKLSVSDQQELMAVTDPAGERWGMNYDISGNLTSFTDPRGAQDRYGYDADGRITSDTNALGGGWTIARSGASGKTGSSVVTMTSGAGRVYSFAMSSEADGSNLDVATAPDGTVSSLLLSPNDVRTRTYADGVVKTTQEAPDPRFGLESPYTSTTTIQQPSGLTFTQSEARSVTTLSPGIIELTDSTSGNGLTATQVFNPTRNTWTTTTTGGRSIVVWVDDLDRPVTASIPGIAPLHYTYDSAGRVLTVSATDGTSTRTTSYSYYSSGPAKGWLQSVIDPLGQTTSYLYDAAGRVTQETLPDGEMVGFTYDADGNLTSVIPPGKSAHSFSYDAVNDATSQMAPPVAGQMPLAFHYAYNLDQQLTSITRPDGSTVNLAYDSGGRLTTETLPDGSAYQYAYAAKTGQLASIVAPGGETLAESWDGSLNTQTQWSGPVAGTVSRTYDNNFWVTALTVDGQTFPIGNDADGSPSILGTPSGSTLSIWRDGLSDYRITGTTYPGTSMSTASTAAAALKSAVISRSAGGHSAVPNTVACPPNCPKPPPPSTTVDTWRTYDGFGQIAQLSAISYGTTVYQASLTRDADGRITQEVEDLNGATTTWGYTYDARGRLATVSENGSVVDTYGYDGNGNRISVNGQTVATYNADDQLTSYNGVPYTYAADGSLASAGSTTYQYDALGHLLAVKTPTETITYTYDGLGRRVGKSVNGTLVQGFLYADGLHPIAELDGQGNVVETFVYGTRPNVPDLMLKGGVTYRIISDQLGSPVEVINTVTGAVVEQITYDAWGTITSDSNPGFQPFGFAGGLYDADTGLVHFGARDYDPAIGRWTARDPLGFAGGDTNLYGYVLQDPVNLEDPSGLFLWPWESPVTVEGGTQAQQQVIQADARLIFSTPRGQWLMHEIVGPWYEPGNPQTIHLNNQHNDSALLGDGVVNIDPNDHPCINTTEGRRPASTLRILAHELGHSVTGRGDNGPGMMNNITWNENPIMMELGRPPRISYY